VTGPLYPEIESVILEKDPQTKCVLTQSLYQDWSEGRLIRDLNARVLALDEPGRPSRPQLVAPREVPRRSLSTPQGRIIMLHSFAHIEFNAINLALDAAYRFRGMPDAFVSDWLQVAVEEAYHFSLIDAYLGELGSYYGEYDAHNGLWDMVCKTRHDVLHRMALVPRVMEARGLDVTPGMMDKFRQTGDLRAVEILRVIYQEEVGHVAIGNRWYLYCCVQNGQEPRSTFQRLIKQYFDGKLRGPFNRPARLQAGFDEDELSELENCL
jgi:uncharacterized ferritin-like protein (DUF455 family)